MKLVNFPPEIVTQSQLTSSQPKIVIFPYKHGDFRTEDTSFSHGFPHEFPMDFPWISLDFLMVFLSCPLICPRFPWHFPANQSPHFP